MATLTYTPFADGAVLTAAQLNAFMLAVQTIISTTKFDIDNLSTPYALFAMPLAHASLASGSTRVFRWKVPASTTLVPVSVVFGFTSGAAAPTFQFTTGGANVLSSALTAAAAATTYESTAFATTTLVAAAEVLFTMTGAGGATAVDLTATVVFKAYVRS